MAEDDCGDIEYLDEDEDLVQQYVQNAAGETNDEGFEQKTPAGPAASLLVERRTSETKRKVKSQEEDSDYDPDLDLYQQRYSKKRKIFKKKSSVLKVTETVENKIVYKTPLENTKFYTKLNKKQSKNAIVADRKRNNIKIPNYEDALCLPGRSFRRDDNDVKRLKNWNKLCLDQFKKNEGVLKTEQGAVVKSSRSFVFRNVQNSDGGRVETSIWSKSTAENKEGHKKSEVFQSVLPYFREYNAVRPYQLWKAPRTNNVSKYEMILTKEDNKNEQCLVAYNTKDCVSTVFKSFMRNNDDVEIPEDDNRRLCLKESTCCAICAPCFQVSWRGVRKTEKPTNINCEICSRSFVSIYNLLAHLKSHHSDVDVRKYKKQISKTLAKFVDYHYKCRICQGQFDGIKELKRHVISHQGKEVFTCEVGNHVAN